jgi:hypothetical protein
MDYTKEQVKELIEGYALMRFTLNCVADKSITINQMDKILALKKPELDTTIQKDIEEKFYEVLNK